MIQNILLNAQMIWIIFTKILKNGLQVRDGKHWLYFMIWLLICLVIEVLEEEN